MLPLDVYLENEHELSTAAAVGQTVDGLKGTVGEKLMSRDIDTRVVVNFHGVSTFSSILMRFTCMPFLHRMFSRFPKILLSRQPPTVLVLRIHDAFLNILTSCQWHAKLPSLHDNLNLTPPPRTLAT